MALHLVLGAAVVLSRPGVLPGLLLLLLAAWHFRARFPQAAPMLLICPGAGFALPSEGRYQLRLASGTLAAPAWIRLTFDDRPAQGLLLLRDQFTPADWRRLTLAVRER